MKYRLKKDLPFAKVGEPVSFIQMTRNQTKGYDVIAGAIRLWINSEKDLDEMLLGGWIEEVKPREWWVLKPKDHSTAGLNVRWYKNPDYARDDYEKEINKAWFEIIKVREVIE